MRLDLPSSWDMAGRSGVHQITRRTRRAIGRACLILLASQEGSEDAEDRQTELNMLAEGGISDEEGAGKEQSWVSVPFIAESPT